MTRIFKKGSKTYFYNSMFFPSNVKDDVFILYSFVRKADNFVDAVPQQVEEFYQFKARYEQAMAGEPSGDVVIDSFVEMSYRKDFPKQWTDAFLHSMEMDITKDTYGNMAEVDTYIFGSAEVIGLYMSQILGLPEQTHPYAQYLGKAMQYINFIRDINEDLDLGRSYFPRHDYEQYGLTGLTPEEARANPEGFRAFVRKQIERYDEWQERAEEGFKYIPKRVLIPILNASEMYKWTADQIREDPFIVYQEKVKPSIPRILVTMGLNTLRSVAIEDLSGEVGGTMDDKGGLSGEVREWRPIGSCEVGCHLS